MARHARSEQRPRPAAGFGAEKSWQTARIGARVASEQSLEKAGSTFSRAAARNASEDQRARFFSLAGPEEGERRGTGRGEKGRRTCSSSRTRSTSRGSDSWRSFLGLLKRPRRHGWILLEILARTPSWMGPKVAPSSLPPSPRSWRCKKNVTRRLWQFSASGGLFRGSRVVPNGCWRPERWPENHSSPDLQRLENQRKADAADDGRDDDPPRWCSTPRTLHLGRRYVVGASKPLALCRHSRDTR